MQMVRGGVANYIVINRQTVYLLFTRPVVSAIVRRVPFPYDLCARIPRLAEHSRKNVPLGAKDNVIETPLKADGNLVVKAFRYLNQLLGLF